MATNNDFSLYIYYKGSEDYPNNKERFFGGIEKVFHNTYEGKEEDKEEAFKDYITHYLSEITKDGFMGEYPLGAYTKAFEENLRVYFEKEYKASGWG